jgi:hypothetical protein
MMCFTTRVVLIGLATGFGVLNKASATDPAPERFSVSAGITTDDAVHRQFKHTLAQVG